ncbi:MAG TPA: DUF2085 domain-containing protein [Bacteroidota bacterium]
MRFARITYAVILSGTAAWCALIVLAPAATSSPRFVPFGGILYAFFSPLCHQIDARSFHLFGGPLAVCGRCSAIYFGFLFGTIAYPFAGNLLRGARRGRMFLIVAVAPMLLDVMLEVTGLHESSNALHAVTGAWFGILLPFLIIPGAVEGIGQLLTQPNPHSIQSEKGLIDA